MNNYLAAGMIWKMHCTGFRKYGYTNRQILAKWYHFAVSPVYL